MTATPPASDALVSAIAFSQEYHGHPTEHLQSVINRLRGPDPSSPRAAVFLLGDSSLDNKFWLGPTMNDAVNGYETAITPPVMKPDIAYWINRKLLDAGRADGDGGLPFCVNCAVEESTISDRSGGLLPHDLIVRDNIMKEDTLIISLGGNDIALKPSISTIGSVLSLKMQPKSWIESGSAIGFGHMKSMFKGKIEDYIRQLCVKSKPKRVIVCMIYYLDECSSSESWANLALSALGYNRKPEIVQHLIRQIYEQATCHINVDGVEVVPFPLFEVLDGKDPSDYIARVEPSVTGGEKMAAALVAAMKST